MIHLFPDSKHELFICYFQHKLTIKNFKYPLAFFIQLAGLFSKDRKRSIIKPKPIPNHVAVMVKNKNKFFICEAIGHGVVLSDPTERLDTFLGDIYIEPIDAEVEHLRDAYKFIEESLGKDYSPSLAIYSFIDGFIGKLLLRSKKIQKRIKKKFFCSYFVAEILTRLNHTINNEKNASYEQEPVDLLFSNRSYKGQIYTPQIVLYEKQYVRNK